MNVELLNQAVHLGLEWGEHWMSPIGPRMMKLHPHLCENELDELEALSRAVQKFAFAMYEEVYFEKTTREAAEAQIKARFSFLDEHNLTHLYNQGMYYAWHG